MLKILLVLVYLYSGEVKMEVQAFKDVESCIKAGHARIEKQIQDPKFDAGLFADCVPSLVTEAQK